MAIAFYDSGRLLPYRHKQLSEQIAQRNQDAERTRQYIGYAGGAFANMAEKTGQIFGADLYSGHRGHPDTARKAGGQEVSFKGEKQPQEYFGGTIGRDTAKAGWQKGVTDQENRRRETTHRLGLLMKNVEYGNFQRDWEAWGGLDKEELRKNYNTRWDQFIKDQQLGEDKLVIMQRYSDMYDPTTQAKLKIWHEGKLDKEIESGRLTEEGKQAFKEQLEQAVMSNNTFEKYAENNGLYNKSVAARPREDVNLLLAYLKDGVKFPGMNQIMDQYSKEKENRKDLRQEIKLKQGDQSNNLYKQTLDSIVSSNKPKDKTQDNTIDSYDKLLEPDRFTKNTGKKIHTITNQVNKNESEDLTEAMILANNPDGIWAVKAKDIDKNGNKLVGFPRFLEFSGRVLDTAAEIWRGGGSIFGDEWYAIGTYESNREKHGLVNKILHDLLDGELTEENKKQASEWADDLYQKIRSKIEVLQKEYGDKQGVKYQPGGLRVMGQEYTSDLSPVNVDNEGARLNQVFQNLMAHEDSKPDGKVIDDNKHPILAGSVDAWELVNRDEELMKSVMINQLGLTEGSKAWKDFTNYFMSTNPKEHLGHQTDKNRYLSITQIQNRDNVRLNPAQTKSLVMWAYNKNKSALESYNNDIPLNSNVYKNYPALEQMLGDLAYRHGGDFMTKKGGYVRFKQALKTALNTNSRSEADSSIDDMFNELFYSKQYKNETGARVNFLKDRLARFRARILSPYRFNTTLGMGSLQAPDESFDLNNLTIDNTGLNINAQTNDMSTRINTSSLIPGT